MGSPRNASAGPEAVVARAAAPAAARAEPVPLSADTGIGSPSPSLLGRDVETERALPLAPDTEGGPAASRRTGTE